MLSVQPQIVGVTFQTQFPEPIPFSKANIETTAQRILTALKHLGVGPGQFQVVKSDDLFGYDLRLNIFQGNGTYSLNPQRAEISLQNARSKDDLNLVVSCLVLLSESTPSPESSTSFLQAHMHCSVESTSRGKYFSDLIKLGEHIVVGGLIAYSKPPDWEDEIRLQVDRSLILEAGLFFAWTTRLRVSKLSREMVERVSNHFDEMLKRCGIEIRPA